MTFGKKEHCDETTRFRRKMSGRVKRNKQFEMAMKVCLLIIALLLLIVIVVGV